MPGIVTLHKRRHAVSHTAVILFSCSASVEWFYFWSCVEASVLHVSYSTWVQKCKNCIQPGNSPVMCGFCNITVSSVLSSPPAFIVHAETQEVRTTFTLAVNANTAAMAIHSANINLTKLADIYAYLSTQPQSSQRGIEQSVAAIIRNPIHNCDSKCHVCFFHWLFVQLGPHQ